MDELCGTKGGWNRVAYLGMTFKYSHCPSGFKLYKSGEVRACGRPTSSGASCTSIRFPSHGTSYSQVCGRVVGYQYGSIDAIQNFIYVTKAANDPNHEDIDKYYVDGVSITHGYLYLDLDGCIIVIHTIMTLLTVLVILKVVLNLLLVMITFVSLVILITITLHTRSTVGW